MEVTLAKSAGFCFGVQRAVDKVYELIDSCPDRLFTLGPIIHNEEVVSDLEKKGVRVASEEDLKALPSGSTCITSKTLPGTMPRGFSNITTSSFDADVACDFAIKKPTTNNNTIPVTIPAT